MPQKNYLPEGSLLDTPENQMLIRTANSMKRAQKEKKIVEGIATMCDKNKTLHVQLGKQRGLIFKEEAGLGAEQGKMRDIALYTRVGKPVCFHVCRKEGETWILSRRSVQEEAKNYFQKNLLSGEVIRTAVTHLEQFGAFVDIGCGLISMIPVDSISVSRIRHAADRFSVGQSIYAIVKSVESNGRVVLSHRELLGTWRENAESLQIGSVVRGLIRGVESYGVFVELTPNLSGLAESVPGAVVGMNASVYVKSILPERLKIKLNILDLSPGDGVRKIKEDDYRLTHGQLHHWQYQPTQCISRIIESSFL